MIVRKVRSEDFSKVYPLLKTFNNSRLQEKDWQRLFQNHWNMDNAYYGYLLEENENVVGYLGAVFSERWINEEKHLLCNLTSWIVHENYRGHGGKLLKPLLEIPNCTIVNLTCNEITAKIFSKLRFTPYETKARKLFKLPQLKALFQSVDVIEESQEILSLLSDREKKLYEDHKAFNCKQIVLKSGENYCYLVITLRGKKGKIHYVGDKEVFKRLIKASLFKLCQRMKINSLQVDERFLENVTIIGSVKKKLLYPKFYRSDTLNSKHIDELYTELLLLG